VQDAPVDYDELSALGIPLSVGRVVAVQKSARTLFSRLRLACAALFTQSGPLTREHEAIEATLLAIRDHYPRLFSEHVRRAAVFRDFIPENPGPRHVRLRRVALSILGSYL
jgi:hypothetical protein